MNTLTAHEEDFVLGVFDELNGMRDNLDRDLFALLAHRLVSAGYDASHLESIVETAADFQASPNLH